MPVPHDFGKALLVRHRRSALLLAAATATGLAMLLTGCVPSPETPNPTSSETGSPNPSSTDGTMNPDGTVNPDGEDTPGAEEEENPGFDYDVAEVAAAYERATEAGAEQVTTVPETVKAPTGKQMNYGFAPEGPVPLPANVNEDSQDWLVDVKGWEVRDDLPGAGAAPAGQQWAVAYFDVALAEGKGAFGGELYVSFIVDGEFYTLGQAPETYEGDYTKYTWEAPGVKKGLVAAVAVPAGTSIDQFGFSIYGNGTLLIIDADGEQ